MVAGATPPFARWRRAGRPPLRALATGWTAPLEARSGKVALSGLVEFARG